MRSPIPKFCPWVLKHPVYLTIVSVTFCTVYLEVESSPFNFLNMDGLIASVVTLNNCGHEVFAVFVIVLARNEFFWWEFYTFTFCSLIFRCHLTVSTLYNSCYFSSHGQVLGIHVKSVAPVFCASQIRCYVLCFINFNTTGASAMKCYKIIPKFLGHYSVSKLYFR
jgi:hypothetical protein